MTLANFKLKVAAYLNRDATSFVIGGVDNILEAINDARRTAMLKYDFNYLKTTGYLVVPTAGVDWLANMKDAVGGAALPVGRISEVWSIDTSVTPPKPVDLFYTEIGWNRDNPNSSYVMIDGPLLRVVGSTASQTVMVKCTKFLADLTSGSVNDFFLDQGGTWLLYQTIQNLNLYLKEDQRVQLADSVVQRAWNDFIAWDGSMSINTTSRNLD